MGESLGGKIWTGTSNERVIAMKTSSYALNNMKMEIHYHSAQMKFSFGTSFSVQST